MSTGDNSTSRAYTAEEAREMFLNQVRAYAEYWAELPGKTDKERCDGLAFSLMNIFDGTSAGLPALDIVARPHPADKPYHIDEGTNYFEDGTVLNNCMLHELYYPR
jgi:hypothetical protein